jgi:phosphoglycerate dehydrogenase-like enzyme
MGTTAADDGKIVLGVFGGVGSHAIRLLCEADSTKPLPERKVQWIHSFSTGTDAYDFKTLAPTIGTIPFSNARGVYADSLAEHVVLAMLYFNRQVWQLQRNRENRMYDRFPHNRLLGQTLGIVGYGNIGEQCAKRAVSFGMKVLGLRRTAPREPTDSLGVELLHGSDGIEQLLSRSDFVLNIMPSTAENYHFFNTAAFAKMKRDAVYINIGRGSTQSEENLVAALRENLIRGAAVDVFEKEPLPAESELWSLGSDKLLLTPHNADINHDCFDEAVQQFVAYSQAFVNRGQLPTYLVDTSGKGY